MAIKELIQLNSILDTESKIIHFMGSNKYIITKIKCWPVFKQDPWMAKRVQKVEKRGQNFILTGRVCNGSILAFRRPYQETRALKTTTSDVTLRDSWRRAKSTLGGTFWRSWDISTQLPLSRKICEREQVRGGKIFLWK